MSRTIVTHKAPDLDAITSVWLIKRFVPGWQDAKLKFVPAGQKLPGTYTKEGQPIELIGETEVITVDTGMGALDHHQFQDETICGASLTLDFVLSQPNNSLSSKQLRVDAARKIVDLVIDEDHFQQVFYNDSASFIREFTIVGILDGRKLLFPAHDEVNAKFGMECLDALLVSFESRLDAEREMEKGIEFKSPWGKGIAFKTVNDSVMKLAQIKGYAVAVRKDPSSDLIRVKSLPRRRADKKNEKAAMKEYHIDLTPVYEIVKDKDKYASWFLHASKRMLLNGSSKNPNTIPSKLSLEDMIEIISSLKK